MDKKNIIIGALLIIVILLGGYFCYDMVINRKEEEKEQPKKQETIVERYEQKMEHFTEATIVEEDDYKQAFVIENGTFKEITTYKGKEYQTKISGIDGTAKYFNYTIDCGAIINIIVLTEEGNIYEGDSQVYLNNDLAALSQNKITFKKLNIQEKIQDIGLKKLEFQNCVRGKFIFQTEEGKILDLEGKEVNVIETLGNIYFPGDLMLFINKDQTVKFEKAYEPKVHLKYDTTEGYVVDNNGQKIKIKSIIALSNGSAKDEKSDECDMDFSKTKVFIIASDDYLYSFDSSRVTDDAKEITVQLESKQKVKTLQNLNLGYSACDSANFHQPINKYTQLSGFITLEDGSDIELSNVEEAFILEKNK